ncbi:ribulose-phosphate 3-epimerase [bacterium]|nr:ribulose-phosphate 3-epimerase [bacterium]
MKKQIAPSILSADFSKLGEEIQAVEKAGAEVIHFDVMDGHFVPNITIGPAVAKSIRKCTKLPIDAHLMIEDPEKYIEAFAKAGVDWISVHVEACDLEKLLPKIKSLGCRAGAVINPPTPLDKLLPYVHLADFVLVMTVNPGFGGQGMIAKCLEKIVKLRKYINDNKLKTFIEVDGGVKIDNINTVSAAGSDVIVVGSAIFGSKDYAKTISEMKKNLTCHSDPE